MIQLLEMLQNEIEDSSVAATRNSKVVVCIDDSELILSHQDAELLLHNEATVDRFFEALGCPADSAIELHNLTTEDEVFSALEKRFVTVDQM